MKKLIIGVAVVMLLAGTAFAADCGPKHWDDMSWWGNSGATPEPQADKGAAICGGEPRSCYWWWPKEPTSNSGDSELWGNRGVVYHCWEKPVPPVPPTPVAPPPPTPTRQKPLFNNVLFDFDKAVLKPEGKAVVDQVVAELKAHPQDTIVIEGHTCDIGTDEYNMGLGQRSADAVQKYMVENGIEAARVTTKSLGETAPAVPNDGPANRKLNRRAMFDITIVGP